MRLSDVKSVLNAKVLSGESEKQLSEKLADDAINLTKNIANTAISVGKTVLSGGEKKSK